MSYKYLCPVHGPQYEFPCPECPAPPTWKAACGCPSGTYHKPECEFGQRATDQEIEDDLRDQIANGGC